VARNHDQSAAMPRWVKRSLVFACIFGIILIVVVLSGIGGPHGPGRHLEAQPYAGQANPEQSH
jgi:hypothetical protein